MDRGVDMKTRYGYVSNSSSSSFILAISRDKHIKCDKCGIDFCSIFEFISRTFKKLEDLSLYWPVPSDTEKSLDAISYAIEELENDIKFAESELTAICKIKNDENASIIFSKLQSAVSKLSVRHARFMSEHTSVNAAVENEERFIQSEINDIEKRIEHLRIIHDKIDKIQDDYDIYAFNVSIHDSMYRFVVDAIDNNLVQLIERID